MTEADSDYTIVAFEGECLKRLRERLISEADLEPSGRTITEVSLLGWYPNTKLVATARSRRGQEQRWEWPLWGDDALSLALPPGSEGRGRSAVEIATSIALTALEEPPWD